MCGRFVAKYSPDVMKRLFPELEGVPFPTLKQRYNAAPSQQLPIIRVSPDAPDAGQPQLQVVEATWGIVPSWSKDGKPGPINARCETVATNGLFRAPFRRQRCIVMADGFYEWQERMLQPKRPLYITRADEQPLLFAALWDRHKGHDSFTIVTVPAADAIKPIHDRSPAVLEPGDDARAWLNPATAPEQVAALLRPVADGLLSWHQVSARVNNPRNDGPELIQAVPDDD